jgi:hypothetical protein
MALEAETRLYPVAGSEKGKQTLRTHHKTNKLTFLHREKSSKTNKKKI